VSLAVKHVALCAKGWIFSDRQGLQVRSHQEVETFPGINISAHNIVGGKTSLYGAAISTELIKKGGS